MITAFRHRSLQSSLLGGLFAIATAGAAGAQSLTFTSPDVSGTIMGAPGVPQPFPLVVTNTASEAGPITNVTLEIDTLTTSDLSSLELFLTAPGGADILVLKGFGTNGGSSNYANVIFDDAATTSITGGTGTTIAGPFRPEGQAGDGVFLTSTVSDLGGFNGNTLAVGPNSWTLTAFNTALEPFMFSGARLNVTASIPEPGTIAGTLLAVGLGLGLFVARHRQRGTSQTITRNID